MPSTPSAASAASGPAPGAAAGAEAVAILEADFSGGGTFEQPNDYDVGDQPQALAVGDFDDDGKRDLAVANGLDGDVSILEGKSNGTLKPKVDFVVGSQAHRGRRGRLRSRRQRGLAVTNEGNETVSILLNDE